MPRIRYLKHGFFLDEELCALPFSHRIGYEGLWVLADREGRLEDRPKRIKAQVFPYDDIDMEVVLTGLARAGFILRYIANGKAYIALKSEAWKKHQRPRADEGPSEIPPPDNRSAAYASLGDEEQIGVSLRDSDKTLRDSDGDGSVERIGIGIGMGTGIGTGECAEPSSTPPAVLLFPTVGKDGSEWGLTQELVSSWSETFPALDVLGECRKARAWIHANPDRRKTVRGMQKFLLGWLTRATDGFRGHVPERRMVLKPKADYDWFEECKRVHGGACELDRYKHALRMETESLA